MLRIVRETAADNKLTVTDQSKETAEDLRNIGAQSKLGYDVSASIDLNVTKAGKVKAMISNLGLSPHQVLLSFFGNGNGADRAFSADLTRRLSKSYQITNVPVSRGAVPITSCPR